VLSQQLEQPEMTTRHLNQTELARRWRMSERTLERWRWLGQPPRFLKIGGRVVYRIEDIEAFEAKQLRQRTPRRRRSGMSTIEMMDGQNV
jgi:predicted DNA-binding transcriptional regulator AlpA